MYGRKRTESGSSQELGTYFERFESKPPPETTLRWREWSAFHLVAHALADTATADDHGNAGRRITTGCCCRRCRATATVVRLPVASQLRRAA